MRTIALALVMVFSLAMFYGCAGHGTGKATAPGQIKKDTGYNYKSGK